MTFLRRAFGGLDRESLRFLDGLARHGGSPRRRLKSGTVLVRDYQGQHHTVTVVSDGFDWQECRSGGVWEIKIEYRLDLVSTPAAADWDASFTAKSINLGKNTAKGSQRKRARDPRAANWSCEGTNRLAPAASGGSVFSNRRKRESLHLMLVGGRRRDGSTNQLN